MRVWLRSLGPGHRLLPHEQGAAGILPWLIAVMALLSALAMVGGLTLAQSARGVAAGLGSRATVQIVDPNIATAAAQAGAALAVLRGDPAVAQVRRVPRSELVRLLEPWLGPGVRAGDLPLPPSFEVVLAPQADIKRLRARLTAAAPGGRLDVHADWLAPLARFLLGLQLIAAGVVALVALASAWAVALGVRASLADYRPTIEVLHLMGAEDAAIAAVFQRRFFVYGLLGGLGGTLCACLVISSLVTGLDALQPDGRGVIPAVAWAALAALPLALGVLAMAAARVSVLRALRDQL